MTKSHSKDPKHLSPQVSGALRQFGYWIANGSMGLPVLDGIDYRPVLMREPSAMERIMAIFANVLEISETGEVRNAKAAERRAAEWLRAYIDPSFAPSRPFEDWEIALH